MISASVLTAHGNLSDYPEVDELVWINGDTYGDPAKMAQEFGQGGVLFVNTAVAAAVYVEECVA